MKYPSIREWIHCSIFIWWTIRQNEKNEILTYTITGQNCATTDIRHKMDYTTDLYLSSVQSLSRVWLCDLMNRSTPGLPVHHQLPELTQLMSIELVMPSSPSHPLSSPSLPAPNPSQHQGLFQRVNSSHEVAKVLEFQLQHQSFQWIPRTDLL